MLRLLQVIEKNYGMSKVIPYKNLFVGAINLGNTFIKNKFIAISVFRAYSIY